VNPLASKVEFAETEDSRTIAVAHAEFASLRSEIVTRVIFQNIVLCLTLSGLTAISAAALIVSRPELLLVHSVLGVSASAMWAHHGARTAQIRSYLTSTLEPILYPSPVAGWEHALAGMRFRSLLGSRWYVSTKGFFIGSHVVVVALLLANHPAAWSILISLAALTGTVWLLNEPSLHSQDPVADMRIRSAAPFDSTSRNA
jgi:hypothetical protein